jgi:membrane protein
MDRKHPLILLKVKFQTLIRALRCVAEDTWELIRSAKLFTAASSLSYVTILSLVPLLAVSFAIFHAFGGLDRLYVLVQPLIFQYLAEGADDEALQTLHTLVTEIHAGAVGATGSITLILISMNLLSNVEKSINSIWQTKIKRSPFQRFAYYWLFITLGPLSLAVILGAITAQPAPLTSLLPAATPALVIQLGFFFLIYLWVPNRPVHWIAAFCGAIFTATAWTLAGYGYGIYTQRVVDYSTIYGALGAIPLLLVWIFVSWLVLLTGAAVTAAIQKRFDLR